jgi:hypothetical protein
MISATPKKECAPASPLAPASLRKDAPAPRAATQAFRLKLNSSIFALQTAPLFREFEKSNLQHMSQLTHGH